MITPSFNTSSSNWRSILARMAPAIVLNITLMVIGILGLLNFQGTANMSFSHSLLWTLTPLISLAAVYAQSIFLRLMNNRP